MNSIICRTSISAGTFLGIAYFGNADDALRYALLIKEAAIQLPPI
jgi:YQGE family putative transporter